MATFYNTATGQPNSVAQPSNDDFFNHQNEDTQSLKQRNHVQQPNNYNYQPQQHQYQHQYHPPHQQHQYPQQQQQQQSQIDQNYRSQSQGQSYNQNYQQNNSNATSFLGSMMGQNKNSDGNMPMPNIFTPATAAAAAAIISENQGTFISSLIDIPGQMQPGMGRVLSLLRPYFAVDNRYVMKKMQRILCPFLFKVWKRQELEPIIPPPKPDGSYAPAIVNFVPPTNDENAPDLYIPLMSLVTYALLAALLYGSSGEFTPEVLTKVVTKCFVTQAIEVSIIRLAIYTMGANTHFLDLFSYTGYKYFGLCLNLLVGLVGFGYTGYIVTFLWTAIGMSYFMLKVMSSSIPKQTSHTGPKRELVILAFAFSQFVTMWFVSQTKHLE